MKKRLDAWNAALAAVAQLIVNIAVIATFLGLSYTLFANLVTRDDIETLATHVDESNAAQDANYEARFDRLEELIRNATNSTNGTHQP